jgi:hypothetical protein
VPIAEGAFVKTLFPTTERPRRPGLPHIGYCLAVVRPLVLVAYTTSQPWPDGAPVPLGVRVFGAAEAARLNQRPFVLRLDRLAKLPLTRAWFPEIHLPSQGVVATAQRRLCDEILATMDALLRLRRERLTTLGP